MFTPKALLLAILLLAAETFAARINYSAKYTDGREIRHTQKLGTIPDDKVQDIIQHMRTWSNNQYDARISAHNMVIVSNTAPASSKSAASAHVQQMQSIANRHILH
ncbi:hypothetical protein F5Y00DRAFT_267187 [Daldinia vernicosa]|uniref:uncharacterized protein n=1 Tax=Daldinia vernicosa TaxID=114800 RepID=UPI002008BFBC|nr:uncharacterized protein F5Y00DRAFT_267187 [Daldinia vernicosa]KAI0843821.1 hypothetical protein F5Y00DRAFT_267187 [Daldinia vernicosa]